ncbi:Listeria-Bacteroides repeat domain (List_Bact_rpt) [Planctomycetes bacterium Poly30]|uniref:Listeria-Bacteroides repeat domain (List_Bact_rpt) n=1 Tax=Saltatorellus ferox TaxID=2528018 RepID=A0A518EYG7_9BACT|nr:Listeria-Bacteroides repeat domain (List_Bact_rpt) [Planctomycetes bacterium Poly30]
MRSQNTTLASILPRLALGLSLALLTQGCHDSHSSSSPASLYYLSYHGNGGGGTAPDYVPLTEGQTMAVAPATHLTFTNRAFEGWNTNPAGNGEDYAVGDMFTMGTEDMVLYAQWSPVTYGVTYDDNGSDGGMTPVDSARYGVGASVTVLSEASLALTDHDFAGWNTEAAGSGLSYDAGDTFSMPASDVTLYAQWVAVAMVSAQPGDGQSSLTWSPVVGATDYNVYYHTSDDLLSASLWNASVGLISAEAATVHGLSNATPYYFWITANTPSGEVPVNANAVVATPDSGIFSPSVSEIQPGENALEVSLDKVVTIRFNALLNAATINDTNVSVTVGGVPVDLVLAVNVTGDTIEIQPLAGSWADGATHVVSLSSQIADQGGATLPADYSFQFTTLSSASLVGRWIFDNSSVDVSGNGAHASATNVSYDALSRHQGTHSVSLTAPSSVSIGALDLGQEFSYTAWINLSNSVNNIQTLFANAASNVQTSGIKVHVNSWNTNNRAVVIECGIGSTGVKLQTDTGIIQSGNWYHVAVTVDRTAGEAKIYFNGALAPTYVGGSLSNSILTDFQNQSTVYLNEFADGGWNYNGLQDDVRIYNRILTAAEIANIANEN